MFRKFNDQLGAFLSKQYLVLILIITTSLKLIYMNTYVLKMTWPFNQYIYGVMFGFISCALLFAPLFFIKKSKNVIALIIASILSMLLFIDQIYFYYFSSLPSVGILSSVGQAGDVSSSIAAILNVGFVIYFIDIVLIIIFKKPIQAYFQARSQKYTKLKTKTNIISFLIVFGAFWLAFLPMGFSKFNDVIERGYDTKSTAQYYGVFMAHLVDIIRYVKEETTHISASDAKEISDWVNQNKPDQPDDTMTAIANGKNVIMIQIESLGGFVLNQTVGDNEVTPNLDKLASESDYYSNNRFVISAGHTSDTDFVANTSYFPLNDSAVFVRYGHDDFTSLPKTLVENGYSAYAYHGYNRNFWNRNVALSSLGYQKFYAADNYPDGKKINLGLNDGDFLDKTADYINDQPKPSLSYVITLTSHTPFEITAETKGLDIDASDYPDGVGGYLQDINYTDRMLGKFFEKLKQYGLYNDSLIIVYGDHTPVLPSFSAGTINYNPDSVQVNEVPLIIKMPNQTEGIVYENTGTSLDITPTIFDLLGIKTNQLMFKQSLYADSDSSLQVCTNQMVSFSNDNCEDMLQQEKNMSSKIIRYNQFNNL